MQLGIKEHEASVAVPETDPVIFIRHGTPTFVPDTNVFLKSLPFVKSIMNKMTKDECFVAIPYQVYRELDRQQHSNSSQLCFQARQALRLVAQFKAHLFTQSLTAWVADLSTLRGKCFRFF